MSDVLIADDSPADRANLRTHLDRHGFRVHEVEAAAEVLSRASAVRPHVIVLGVRLPELDGISLCRQLRSDPLLGAVPVLMLTGRDADGDVRAGFEAGADDYVTRDGDPEVFLARVRRLSRYRQMADSSLLNEQMAQVGRLLAGIVHEIRGPLGVIRGNAELMRLQLAEGDLALQFAEPIIRGAQVLQLRLEHLMATVRVGKAVLRPLAIVPLVREATDYFRKGSDPRASRVEVHSELSDELPPVLADAGRLIQVLLNLLANAREALAAREAGGKIHLSARLETEPRGTRSGLLVEVVDDGPGIPDELLDRIFEPFFTTKEGGTGYGLYLAREILREHDGQLVAGNAPGGGACVGLWLPLEGSGESLSGSRP